MKVKLAAIFFFLFICSFTFAAVAQEKSQAFKVGEYSDESANLSSLAEKYKEFSGEISKNSKTKGVIAFYWGDSFLRLYTARYDEVYKFLETLIRQEQNSSRERIAIQRGGNSLNRSKIARIEFWIVPNGAENPDTREKECALFDCPTLELKGAESIKNVGEPQTFTANLSGGSAAEIEYNWTVSDGKIIEGQGTPVIKVDLSRAKTKEIKITLELDGIPDLCLAHEAAFTARIR